jgi:geranylgeranyl pyrophosphate synthase
VENKILETTEVSFQPLSQALSYLLVGGGKRLRPAIIILAAKLHRFDPRSVHCLAAAVEMLHTATLVHDDMLDNSVVRRGKPTLNQTWDKSATILVGDYLFAQAAYLAADTDNLRVMRIFSDAVMTICSGEIRQTLQANGDGQGQTLDGYYDSIYAKTASLFAASAEAGAVLGELSDEGVASLRDYGYNLGMAFQISDDVLDFTGDQRRLGKPVGSDLRRGLLTLPALNFQAQNPQDQRLARILDDGDMSDVDFLDIIGAIARSGAIEASLAKAREFSSQAQESLAELPDSPYRQALIELADFTLEREK